MCHVVDTLTPPDSQFDACLKDNGCPADMVNAAVQACEASGCSADVCNEDNKNGDDDDAGQCGATVLADCASALSSCIMNSGGSASAICNCRGAYDQCYSDAVRCCWRGCRARVMRCSLCAGMPRGERLGGRAGVHLGGLLVGCVHAVGEPVRGDVRPGMPGWALGARARAAWLTWPRYFLQSGLTPCTMALSECFIKSGGAPAAMCACRGAFDQCYKNAVRGGGRCEPAACRFCRGRDASGVSQGCPAAAVAAVVQGCVLSGCPVAQCTPTELDTCNESGLRPCAQKLSMCIMSSGGAPDAVCACRGAFDKCYQGAGCPAAAVAEMVQGCQEAGCTAAQCMPSDNVYVETCDQVRVVCCLCVRLAAALTWRSQAGLAPCVTALSDCLISAGGNAAAMCACRGTVRARAIRARTHAHSVLLQFDQCYQSAGCPAAAVAAVVQGCVLSGCSAAQCAP